MVTRVWDAVPSLTKGLVDHMSLPWDVQTLGVNL